MLRFAQLFEALDRTTSTAAKVAALERYFEDAPAADAAWAVFFLAGERLRVAVKSADLVAAARDAAGVTDWMFDACIEAVGDRAETIALLIDAAPERAVTSPWRPSLDDAVRWLESLRGLDAAAQQRALIEAWARLDVQSVFLMTKLMTGALRVGVGKRLLVRALAEWSGVPAQAIFHRLMGAWTPSASSFTALFAEDTQDADASRPYPFFLASPLDDTPDALGAAAEWTAEWKWDGVRAQLVCRAGEVWLWSRGEELVTAQFPELADVARLLPPGTVLDGEILAFRDGEPLPFAELQRRIGRKRLGAKILNDVPCVFMAYDQLEHTGTDLRGEPLTVRRDILAETVATVGAPLVLSAVVALDDWTSLERRRDESRERGVEGLMLKRSSSPYRVGRTRGDWWKWKIAPLEIDAILLYAQPGRGRRASLYTDYTFALWDSETPVPVAKAYSGLTDAEIRELDRWIRGHTIEKFGPVRAVAPEQVFELHFENVTPSARHKSGVAVRFPRIHRWRRDVRAADAGRLEDLERMIRR